MVLSTVSAALHFRPPKQLEFPTERSTCSPVLSATNLLLNNLPQRLAISKLTAVRPGLVECGLTSKTIRTGQVTPLKTVLGMRNSLTLARPLLVSPAASTAPPGSAGKTFLALLSTSIAAIYRCGTLATTNKPPSMTSLRSAAGPSLGAINSKGPALCAVCRLTLTTFQANELQSLFINI